MKGKIAFLILVFLIFTSCNEKVKKANTTISEMEKTIDTLDFTNGYSEVNGLKMYYEIYGQGKPLVLIHGGGSTIQSNFEKVIPLFAKTGK